MQKEKLFVIAMIVVIVLLVSSLIILTNPDIFGNLFKETEIIEEGDCVDVHYIGRFYSNDSIFDSSYEDVENKSGGTPLNVFVTLDEEILPSDDFSDYITTVEGFTEGLIGMMEGEEKTIGPIPPDKAYGRKPIEGDTITLLNPETGEDIILEINAIKENSSIPEDFIDVLGNGTTTLVDWRVLIFSVGDITTYYPTWINATTITAINETSMWLYTTPPDDKMENFTWINSTTGMQFWENASSVTHINDSTIIITHDPFIGATFQYGMYNYTVMNKTTDKINVSQTVIDGNETIYTEFNRTITINRNESQLIKSFDFPLILLQQYVSYFEYYLGYNVVDIPFSFSELAGETLIFEVKVIEVYKECQQQS